MSRRRMADVVALNLPLSFLLLGVYGCQTGVVSDPTQLNATAPMNKGASYVGSSVCSSCHSAISAQHAIHGHAHILNKVAGGPPSYPSASPNAGVPNPPGGLAWTNVSYVVGGYLWKARFVDNMGYLITDGTANVNTQWNLTSPSNGTVAGWAPYEPTATTVKPYDVTCFACHTTGPSPEGHQDGLPGIQGTFAESGVQCESCHGPGSRHVADPPNNIYINPESTACGACHSRGLTSETDGLANKDVIPAADGFIGNHEQYQELLASPHADIRCTVCHSSHTSTALQKDSGGLINSCQNCHTTVSKPLHEGIVFVRGNYTEEVTCVSCHMPYAVKSATTASADTVGPLARVGDVRSHIWFINTDNATYTAMFNADGTQVKKDAEGHAAVTLDFVCLRCHNDKGNAFGLTVPQASDIAFNMHQKFGS